MNTMATKLSRSRYMSKVFMKRYWSDIEDAFWDNQAFAEHRRSTFRTCSLGTKAMTKAMMSATIYRARMSALNLSPRFRRSDSNFLEALILMVESSWYLLFVLLITLRMLNTVGKTSNLSPTFLFCHQHTLDFE